MGTLFSHTATLSKLRRRAQKLWILGARNGKIPSQYLLSFCLIRVEASPNSAIWTRGVYDRTQYEMDVTKQCFVAFQALRQHKTLKD